MSETYAVLSHEMQVMHQQINAMARDMDAALNTVAETIQGIMKVSRMYQLSVQEQLDEIRKHINLTPEVAGTDSSTLASVTREGVDL